MGRFERAWILWTAAYLTAYIPFFFIAPRILSDEQFFTVFLPLHLLGMAQNLIALILTIRDLYLREFPDANQKVTWTLLITWTGGIGWVIYVLKYAFKPRGSGYEASV